MDPIPQHGNANDPLTGSDLNQIQNLSLKDHNQKLFFDAEEFKKLCKDSVWSKFKGCDGVCGGGPRDHSSYACLYDWTYQKAAEAPTHKSWSPTAPISPTSYTFS